MARVQPGSERRPLQLTVTVAGAALRTTTVCCRIDAGHCWLVQIRSVPEVTRTASDRAETTNVQAGRIPVSFRVIGTGRPAGAETIAGVAVISSSAHGPVGSASTIGGAVPVGLACAPAVTTPTGPYGRGAPVADPEPEAVLVAVGEPEPLDATTRAASPGPPDPDPPSAFPMKNTIASAVSSTMIRRPQYTGAGWRPRGRVKVLMGEP